MMTLKEWLQSEEKDYGIGLALLGNYSKNRILLQNLSRKPNPKKVEYELKKAFESEEEKSKLLAAKSKKKTAPKNQKQTDPPVDDNTGKKESHSDQVINLMNEEAVSKRLKVVRNNNEVKYEDLPEEIQKLWDVNRDGYKEIRSLHEKLKLMEVAPSEDRAPLLARIDELDGAIIANWEIIDSWQPGTEPATNQSEGIDHKRINANRKYISTNAKKLAEETDAKKLEKLKANIQVRVSELKAAGEEMNEKTVEELKKLGIEW